MAEFKRTPWTIHASDPNHSAVIDLITPSEFDTLPRFTELVDIFGNTVRKGLDDIDQDTRFGFLAYGFIRENTRLPLLQEPGG